MQSITTRWILGTGVTAFTLAGWGLMRYVGPEPVASYLVQASSDTAAQMAVERAHGAVTHDLPIINAVAANLNEAQLASLRHNSSLHVFANRAMALSGAPAPTPPTPPPHPEVQPYIVERTQANIVHAQGVTGQGVTIAFLDTGWWSQHATQTNVAGKNVVLQGYDAINNTAGVGAPSDGYGHGTHVLSIAVNSALAEDGTYIGIAPNASRVIVRAFDKSGAGNYANVIRGMNWILSNASRYNIRVVNMSFGSPVQSNYWEDPLAQAVMKLWQAGIVVVAAAGNSGPAAQTIERPGQRPLCHHGGRIIGQLYAGQSERRFPRILLEYWTDV